MFRKLLVSYGVLIVGVIGLLGLGLAAQFQRHELSTIQSSLRAEAIVIGRRVDGLLDTGRRRSLQAEVQQIGRSLGTRITVIGGDGTVWADSDHEPTTMENHAGRPEVRQAAATGSGVWTRFSRTLEEPMMYLALRSGRPAGQGYFVRMALPLGSVQTQVRQVDRWVLAASLAAAVIAIAAAFGLARWIVAPVHELSQAAGWIADGHYGRQVHVEGRDEIAALARVFNRMARELAERIATMESDRQQLRAVLSSMAEGVVAIDVREHLLFANQAARGLLGLAAEGVIGRPIWELIRTPAIQQAARQALASAEPYHTEITLGGIASWREPAGRVIKVHGARIDNPGSRGAVLVLHDVSELRRLERVRQDFMANVSHELKTPLSAIKACTETLLSGALHDAPYNEQFLRQIDEHAERLHTLILDLLSLARIESDAGACKAHPVSLAPLIEACADRHATPARGQGLALMVEPAPEPLTVRADEEAVRQILDNLVDNAIKYTPAGGRVTVGWRRDGPSALIEVADTGIGIPPEDLPRVFERFYRVDKARSRVMGGTGLGLSIVKHLAQTFGGSVSVSSQLDRGSRFSVRLPLARTD